jgi:hypothetical protein
MNDARTTSEVQEKAPFPCLKSLPTEALVEEHQLLSIDEEYLDGNLHTRISVDGIG